MVPGPWEERAKNPPALFAALAVFDVGYLAETYKEARSLFAERIRALDRIDGYQLVLKAQAAQNDAAMQHAATLINDGLPNRTTK